MILLKVPTTCAAGPQRQRSKMTYVVTCVLTIPLCGKFTFFSLQAILSAVENMGGGTEEY
jgi:hypothetical protein